MTSGVDLGLLTRTMLSVERLDRIVSAAQTAIDGTEKPNVLVVEDDPYMARFIADSLQDLYRIESAGDGESGLQAWEARRHALVILDITLPRRSGIEVLEAMQAADRDQPVVVLTAYGTAEQYYDCVAKGASMFLEKPVGGADRRATCGSVLRQRDFGEVRACLTRTHHRIEEFGNRVTAADRYLSSGRTEKAHTELKGAISAFLNASRLARGPRSAERALAVARGAVTDHPNIEPLQEVKRALNLRFAHHLGVDIQRVIHEFDAVFPLPGAP